MPIKKINIGAAPNDKSGDQLRDAFNKTNENFAELEGGKVDKVEGMGLSANDYTAADKQKLAGIEAAARKTWDAGADIQNGHDLNNYTTPGAYGTRSRATAQSILNRPPGVNTRFALAVYQDSGVSFVTQVMFVGRDGTDTQKVFRRSFDSLSWSVWEEFASVSQLTGIGKNSSPTLTDLNANRVGGMYAATGEAGVSAGLPLNVSYSVLHHQGVSNSGYQLSSPITSVTANRRRMWLRQLFGSDWTAQSEFAFLESANTWSAGQIFNKIGVGGSSTSGALIASNSKNLQANINFSVLDINNGADDGVFTAGRTHRAAYIRMDGNITEAQRGSNPYTLIGAEPVARASSNDNAAGEVTTLYGVRSYATDNSVRSSILDVSAGIRASSDHTGTTSPKSVNGSYGAHLAVNVNATTTVREALGCFAQVSSAGTVQDGYLFRGVYSGGGTYANKWGLHISGSTQNHLEGTLNVTGAVTTGPVRVGQYTLQTLPSASAFNGYEIDVTNATGGPKRCRSNGSVWQIINTNTTVS
ncbi:MAG: pyocin knob domain-containing protein [Acidovorax sp.]|jgi:hypothetical protein|nr:pyocin knob domain-containing protein [Acidovorax sp.]